MGKQPPVQPPSGPNPTFLLAFLLALGVLPAYYPVRTFAFLGWDDGLYVTENPVVRAGLSAESIRRAFTSTTAGNWHPVTMLSLELDRSLFGKGPAGFHVVNLLLHTAATVLLFLWLRRITGRVGRSAWVAALFGLHPLHVESVAWVAERKDVLAGLFWMLTLWAYTWYAEAPSWRRYAWVTASLALGLMAKPMLVTLPCVLLLLDYWPLRRFAFFDPAGAATGPVALRRFGSYPARRLVVEKLPWLALAAVFSVVAVMAEGQGGALRTLDERPLPLRLANAVVAYAVYLRQAVWPSGLAPFYPFPEHGWPAWQVAGAAVLLVTITAIAWRQRRRRPYLLVGWLWYVGTLVPVIGLVSVGDQARADRFTYLPLIGVFIAVAWTVCDSLSTAGLEALVGVGGVVVAACAVATHAQLGYWQDDEHLWRHALTVTTANDFAHNNLGVVLAQRGQFEDAAAHFAAAVEINPRNDNAQVNLARAYLVMGKPQAAIDRLHTALAVHPENAEARHDLDELLHPTPSHLP
jgi:hypothetical protein